MQSIKSAIQHMIHQPVKTLILFIVVMVMGTLMATAICTKENIDSSQQRLEKIIPLSVFFYNKDLYQEKPPAELLRNIKSLDLSIIEQIIALSQVKNFERSTNYNIQTKTYFSTMEDRDTGKHQTLKLCGAKDGSFREYFQGKITICDGRMINAADEVGGKNPVVISDVFAKANDLKVGSVFSVDAKDIDAYAKIGTRADPAVYTVGADHYDFDVVGIYKRAPNYYIDVDGKVSDLTIFDNKIIYTTYTSALEIALKENYKDAQEDPDLDKGILEPTTDFVVVLSKREDLESFMAAAKSIQLPEGYETTNTSITDDATRAPLINLRPITMAMVAVAIAAMTVVLGIAIFFLNRGRKKEIAQLLSAGRKKSSVMGQMMAEVIAITIVGVSIALFAGNTVSQMTAASLVQTEIDKSLKIDETKYAVNQSALKTAMKNGEGSLDGRAVLWVYLAGIASSAAAASIPVALLIRKSGKEEMPS